MSIRRIVLAVVCVAVAFPAICAARTYTLKELESLANKRAWKEVTDHLVDVPAEKRDEQWNALLKKASIGWVELAAQDDPLFALDVADRLLERYPELRQMVEFLAKRTDIGISALRKCYQNPAFAETCTDRARVLTEKDPENHRLSFEVGKLVRLNMRGWVALPYLDRGIPVGQEARCSEEQVWLAVESGLALPSSSYPEPVKIAQSLLIRCQDVLREKAHQQMISGTSYVRENACKTLESQGPLPANVKKACRRKQ